MSQTALPVARNFSGWIRLPVSKRRILLFTLGGSLVGRPSATGRKRSRCVQARRQTPGAGGRACFGAGHPGFRRQVVKVQRAERLCRTTAQSRRRWMIAAPTPILKISAIFQRIASDCTTVTLVFGFIAFYDRVSPPKLPPGYVEF